MDSWAAKICAVVLTAMVYPSSVLAAFLQDDGADGIVSINASSFSDRISQGGHSWADATPNGHLGVAALEALPNSGANNNIGFETQSPRADYRVNFNRTGTHYIWIRGIGSDGDNDSLHVGLDGSAQPDSDRVNGFFPTFGWTNTTMDLVVATIDVPTLGLHTVNIWMREDGTIFDKLVLTTNELYVPQNDGPIQSNQGTPALAAPSIAPNGGTFANSVTVELATAEPSATILYTVDDTDPRSSDTAQLYGGPFELASDTTVRAYAFAPGYLDSLESGASFMIVEGQGPLAFLQDTGTNGIVSINASSASDRIAQGGHSWDEVTPPGHQGTAALGALPNIGANNNTGFEGSSPRADYKINFNRTGTHFVWIRGVSANGDDDSLHVGLDGIAQSTSDRITGFGGSFDWSNSTMDVIVATIDVQTTGLHTLNVWMREDGMVFDKLLLTSNMGYFPENPGPVESPQGTPSLASPTISPNGGSYPDSVTVSLGSNEPSANIFFTTDGTDPRTSGTAQTYLSPFLLTDDATVRTYAVADGFVDSPEASASFAITEAGGPLAFLQDGGAGGIVSINASGAFDRIAQGGHSWEDVYPVGHVGSAALQAQPNIGANRNTGFAALSPRADYRVDFDQTGLHFIWVRGTGADGDDDSLHLGLDGVAQDTSVRLSGFGPSFGWSGTTMNEVRAVIDVPTTGTHTLNVWMREDGMIFDKLVLSTDPTFTPAGTGPTQSAQGTPTLSPPVINPGGGYFSGSKSVTLTSATAGATIVYTVDGSDPRSSGTASVYAGPFEITASATINAAAQLVGYLDSELATNEFTETNCQISRIMPLGDSITEGIFGPVAAGPGIFTRGGYRAPLYRSLVDNGYTIDFDGSLSAGSALVPQIDADHEGRSGWSDDLVADNVYQFLFDNPVDIVLLHIGTNNFETSVDDVARILDEVDRFEADMAVTIKVVVAKIINRKTYHAPTSTFNANLEALILTRMGNGDQVILVDQEGALDYQSDMFDNLHPNSSGYGKMGTTWFTELQSQLSTCGQ